MVKAKKSEQDQDEQQASETENEFGMELDEVVSRAYLLESEVVSLTQDELERLNAIETPRANRSDPAPSIE